MQFAFENCKKRHRKGEPMEYRGRERRKHPRFKAAIPIHIGLINLEKGKSIQAQFEGVIMDMSMEGLGVEVYYPQSEILLLRNRMVGETREFDVEIGASVGIKQVRGVGEVKWTSIASPSVLKMGIFLREMIKEEREKWTNFVTSRSREVFQ
jgi:hypothetical protein